MQSLDHMDESLKAKFAELPEAIQEQLYMDRAFFELVNEVLEKGRWKRSIFFRPICLLFEHLEPTYMDVKLELQNCKKNDSDAAKSTIQICSDLLAKWESILINYGKQERDQYRMKDGSLQPEFEKFLKSLPFIVRYTKTATPNLIIWGREPPSVFSSSMEKYGTGAVPDFIEYTDRKIRDQSGSFKFGDPYSATFTGNNASLPLEIRKPETVVGRGSVGAILTCNFKRSVKLHSGRTNDYVGSMNALLTCAHVPFAWLTELYKAVKSTDYTGGKAIDGFNQKFQFAEYVRPLVPECSLFNTSLDYALIQIKDQFWHYDVQKDVTELRIDENEAKQMIKDACRVQDAWESFDKYKNYTVYKKGIATQVTIGTINRIANDGCIVIHGKDNKRFSADGDSGSLVFVLEDDVLVPIGMIFAGDGVGCSFAIPLKTIFERICLLHSWNSVEVSFMNPKIKGSISVNCPQP